MKHAMGVVVCDAGGDGIELRVNALGLTQEKICNSEQRNAVSSHVVIGAGPAGAGRRARAYLKRISAFRWKLAGAAILHAAQLDTARVPQTKQKGRARQGVGTSGDPCQCGSRRASPVRPIIIYLLCPAQAGSWPLCSSSGGKAAILWIRCCLDVRDGLRA